eukprot:GGOE01002327.1.p1 GENE.GGOE01002327.1~~GGOE01002327.1.p1  ORF type:complete len:400 (+),score=62.49 GGOE01002327.1:59-1201(+)
MHAGDHVELLRNNDKWVFATVQKVTAATQLITLHFTEDGLVKEKNIRFRDSDKFIRLLHKAAADAPPLKVGDVVDVRRSDGSWQRATIQDVNLVTRTYQVIFSINGTSKGKSVPFDMAFHMLKRSGNPITNVPPADADADKGEKAEPKQEGSKPAAGPKKSSDGGHPEEEDLPGPDAKRQLPHEKPSSQSNSRPQTVNQPSGEILTPSLLNKFNASKNIALERRDSAISQQSFRSNRSDALMVVTSGAVNKSHLVDIFEDLGDNLEGQEGMDGDDPDDDMLSIVEELLTPSHDDDMFSEVETSSHIHGDEIQEELDMLHDREHESDGERPRYGERRRGSVSVDRSGRKLRGRRRAKPDRRHNRRQTVEGSAAPELVPVLT